MAKYLDDNGLLYFYQKLKTLLAAKENSFAKNTAFNKNFETTATNIKMNGTQAVGSSSNVARADHVHPSDSTKLGTSGNGANVTVSFTAAAARANIATSEKLSVICGKLAKWYADFKTVAFTGAYSDLSGKPTNLSQFNNDAEYVDLDSLNTWANTTIPEYGYVTASEVETQITSKNYINSTQANTLITSKGYQTAPQVQTLIDQSISTVYKYKGSVATVANLPTTGNEVGDVWNVTSTGMNYVWTGTAWDALGSELDVESITNAEIDVIMAS